MFHVTPRTVVLVFFISEGVGSSMADLSRKARVVNTGSGMNYDIGAGAEKNDPPERISGMSVYNLRGIHRR
ncbi:hypothetical protein B0H13DRAFT_1942377 [Mycena leptocephala]|nr:hypothetical protein B0H13DRAFT_1942377 [Mycena leptocephala]